MTAPVAPRRAPGEEKAVLQTAGGHGQVPDLAEVLAVASDLAAVARALVAHLVSSGYPMTSVYLARGGRLRCLAVHGYVQVFDGMPPMAGMIGQTVTDAQPRELRGVQQHPGYLAAGFDVQDEVCVPVLVGDECVGALNAESTGTLPADAVVVLQRAAAAFSGRLVELGGAPQETPAQQLTRLSGRLAELTRVEQVVAHACHAARALAGAQACALVLPAADGELRVVYADGALARRLAGVLNAPAVSEMAGWVAAGTSCWTLAAAPGSAVGRVSEAHAALTEAGVVRSCLVGLPPARTDRRVSGGFLLVFPDEPQRTFDTDTVELLELFSIHLAGCLRTLAAVAALEEAAAHDPLTGLGHHAAFHAALARRRQRPDGRPSVSAVLVIDLDHFKAVNDTAGHLAGDALLQDAALALAQDLREGDRLFRVGGDEFAALVTVDGRSQAERLAARLVATARRELTVTVSVGIALAEPGEQPVELFARADAALYRAKRAGRDRYA